MNYGAVIERAGRMILRFRYLWLFGLLGGESFSTPSYPGSFGGPFPAGGFGGPFPAGGFPRSGTYFYYSGPSPAPNFFPFASPPPGAIDARTWFSQHPGVIAAIVIGVLLAIVIGLVWYFILGPISAGALVRAAVEHDAERPSSLGQAWNAGLRTYWRVLGLRVAAIVFIVAALVILGSIFFANIAASGFTSSAFGAVGLFFLLFLLVAVAVQVILTLAIRAAVMDDRSVTDAVGAAVALARRRLGRVALVWVISVAVSIGIGIALVLALAILAIPFVILGIISYSVGAGIGIPLVLGILVAIAVFLVAAGAGGAFISVVWTLAYRRFDGEPAAA